MKNYSLSWIILILFTFALFVSVGIGQKENAVKPVKAGDEQKEVVVIEKEVIKEVVIEKEVTEDGWLGNAFYIAKRFEPYGKKAVIEALVISYLEGKWDTASTNEFNNNGSTDRGIWQINNFAHPHITEKCTRDLICSTDYAIELYEKQGWRPWVASWVLSNFW